MSDEHPADSGDDGASPVDPRADAVRRLLAAAVEPVQPAPGSQARLLAKARAQRRGRAGSQPTRLRWAAGALTVTAVVVAGSVYFAGHAGRETSSSSSAAGGAMTAAPSAPSPELAPDAAAQPAAPAPDALSLGAGRSGARDSSSGTFSGSQLKSAAVQIVDLDGDGKYDGLSLDGSTLVAQLSHDGLQRVSLPATGSGARVLGITLLDTASDGLQPVAFVRLQQRTGYAQDTVVSLVAGRLAVLRLGSGPALLTRDVGRTYTCPGPLVVNQGSTQNYLIQGGLLEASTAAVAATRPVGPGCDFA